MTLEDFGVESYVGYRPDRKREKKEIEDARKNSRFKYLRDPDIDEDAKAFQLLIDNYDPNEEFDDYVKGVISGKYVYEECHTGIKTEDFIAEAIKPENVAKRRKAWNEKQERIRYALSCGFVKGGQCRNVKKISKK